MSRSGLSEYDGDDALGHGRWRGMVASATRGKRGQQLFRDLVAALDAMPVKELIYNDLENSEGVCALGAVGRARGIDLSAIDPEDYSRVAEVFDVADCLAQEVEWVNDEWRRESPSDRWHRVRNWAESKLKLPQEGE